MALSEEEKKYTLNEYLRNISYLQDREYQSRIWIKGEGPECQAFDDAVCDFFDIWDPILQDYRDFGITDVQHILLKEFRDQFKAFSDENDIPEEFIDAPEWKRIMNKAKNVLKAFKYLKNEDKHQILQSFLETIEGISNKKYQERVWILGEGPECDDFTETICHFFEEGDDILENYKDFGISNKQYRLLVELKNQFGKFVKEPRSGYLPQEFVDSPEWEKVMNFAKDVLKAFNYPKK